MRAFASQALAARKLAATNTGHLKKNGKQHCCFPFSVALHQVSRDLIEVENTAITAIAHAVKDLLVNVVSNFMNGVVAKDRVHASFVG